MIRKVLLLVLLLCPVSLFAQKRQLTLDDIFDPKKKVRLSGVVQSGFVWIDDQSFIWPRSTVGDEVTDVVLVDAVSGKEKPLFSFDKTQKTLWTVAGLREVPVKKLAYQESLRFDSSRSGVVFPVKDDLYYYSFATDSLRRLTETPEEEEEPTFSPDGKLVAFVRENDLYVVDLATQRERRLTRDGAEEILNGKLDWVYQEEVYGRGIFKAYWWSPDSSRLAYLQLNEKPAGKFTIVDHIPIEQGVEVMRYPKAGTSNPIAKLLVVSVLGDDSRVMETEKYSGAESLIVDVAWTPDSRHVVYQIQNREQSWLDLNLANPKDGTSRTLFRETTKAWVEPSGSGFWLKDGSLLWLSERSGWKHLYHYNADGTLIGPVTSGPWEVRKLYGADPKSGWIYFSATERNPIGVDIYRIRPDGAGLARLSERKGTSEAVFSPKFRYFIGSWSDPATPSQVHLHTAAGRSVRAIEKNEVAALRDFALSTPEFMQVKTRDGFVMEAMMLRPLGFDPSKKYPVYQHTYSGPHAPQVRDAWGGTTYLFHQLLAQKGIVVWICDNRTASGKGAESAWPVYKNFGELELRDLEDGISWLESQPWVDGSRILLNGWSYGGFMTTYALTHSKTWSAGIAGGSVTDWRDYDTIYTERYMLMPQNNPEGYRKSSPRYAAKDLHGTLLLLHGTIDDNVHVQNTIQFAYELQKAGKSFEMMLYAKSRHGVTDPLLSKHLRMTMLGFIERNLLRTEQEH